MCVCVRERERAKERVCVREGDRMCLSVDYFVCVCVSMNVCVCVCVSMYVYVCVCSCSVVFSSTVGFVVSVQITVSAWIWKFVQQERVSGLRYNRFIFWFYFVFRALPKYLQPFKLLHFVFDGS